MVASDADNADLFFGIRGGGGNFGVITEFVLKLHPQRRTVYGGILIFKPTELEQIITETSKWLQTMHANEGMLQVTGVGPDGTVSWPIKIMNSKTQVLSARCYPHCVLQRLRS